MRFWTKYSVWARSSRCCRIRRSRTFWSTATSRSTSSAKGSWRLTSVIFPRRRHLLRIIDKIVSQVGRRVDESTPMVDARLADGSRVNAIIPPLAVDGPLMSIRRFSQDKLMRRGSGGTQGDDARHDGTAGSRRQGEAEHHHCRRYRRR